MFIVHSLQNPCEVGDHCDPRGSVRRNDLLGLHNKKQDRIGASVCYLAHKTQPTITSNSLAGTRDAARKQKGKILPPFHSQDISPSNPFPNTRPKWESTQQCPLSHRTYMRWSFSPFPLPTHNFIPDRKPMWAAASALSYETRVQTCTIWISLLPQHAHTHSHGGQYHIIALV